MSSLKQSIIELARRQATDGAHYLWGGAGNTPGESDGAPYRKKHTLLHPNLPDPAASASASAPKGPPYVPMLFAGWADTSDQGKQVCGGRCALTEVQALEKALPLTDADALQVTLATLKPEQIQMLKDKAKNPGKLRWPRANALLERTGHNCTVWGESCVGVRHFDCVGLVNFCFGTILQYDWTYSIDNVIGGKAGFTEVSIAKAQACDIVTFGADHIGICTGEGSAVEAMDTGEGVQETQLSKRPWTNCWRVAESDFRIGPGKKAATTNR